MDFILIIFLIFSLIIITVYIILFVLKFWYTKEENVGKGLDWMSYVWLAIVIVVIILHFVLKIPTEPFVIFVLIFIIITMVLWRYALFVGHNKDLAEVFILINIVFLSANIIYSYQYNKIYLLALIILTIWEIVIALITWGLTPKQIFKLTGNFTI